VNVNIGVPAPVVVVHEPPEVVLIPERRVFFAPSVEVDLFFFSGYWWTPHRGHWFRSRSSDGPWVVVETRHVPVTVVRVPPDYRKRWGHHERHPFTRVKEHWRGDRWDDDRDDHRGHGKGNGKGHGKGRGRRD
jgi:hypothetical protein